jgi:hypothetical protein
MTYYLSTGRDEEAGGDEPAAHTHTHTRYKFAFVRREVSKLK